MDYFTQFTSRDWLIFFVPYLLWCAIFGLIWVLFIDRRIVSSSIRALVFALLFTPTFFPIVREAFIIGPASLSLLYLALLSLFSKNFNLKLVVFALLADILPILCVWGVYAAILRFMQRIRTRRTNP